jgi:GMP synthase (glutamine-hydrolysing)
MKFEKTARQTTLVVDNLSPFTPDIVLCLDKLGASYIQRSFSSLANVTIDSNYNNSSSTYNYSQNDVDAINNKSKGLGDIANYDKKNNKYIRVSANNNTNHINNTNNINNYNLSCDKVILSGRRMNDRQINIVNSHIIRQCFENNIPLLGICYGAEILALTLGGAIRKMNMPIQDTIPLQVSKSSSLISSDTKTLLVYESHRYCVAKLPEDFESHASSINCEHEIFSHKEKKLFGTQFHPEKSGADGLNLLSKFLSL